MRRAAPLILVAWVGALAWWMRGHILDDAFIHLRYAEQLLVHHFLTYDGVTPSQGTSSVLYVCALAALSAMHHWVYWPKVLAVAGYGALVVLGWRGRRRFGPWAWPMALVLASPMAVRTLTDGMETSWAAVAAALLAALTAGSPEREESRCGLATVALAGMLAAWLRPDMLVIVAAIALAGLVRHRPLRGGVLCAGAALALVIQLAWLGNVVPDGALAKHAPWRVGASFLQNVAWSHMAAASFGGGLVALWVATWWHARRDADMETRRATAVLNIAGPVFWLAVIVSGQITHGVRYFVPFYVFAIVWNALVGGRRRPPSWLETLRSKPRFLVAALVVLGGVWVAELFLLAPIVRTRTETLRALRSERLERFRGRGAVTLDVGQIGYFTRADVCDLRGLVNGRAAALLTDSERRARCWARHPDLAFLGDASAASFPGIAAWPVCGVFLLNNVNTTVAYSLRVRPELGCGFTPP